MVAHAPLQHKSAPHKHTSAAPTRDLSTVQPAWWLGGQRLLLGVTAGHASSDSIDQVVCGFAAEATLGVALMTLLCMGACEEHGFWHHMLQPAHAVCKCCKYGKLICCCLETDVQHGNAR